MLIPLLLSFVKDGKHLAIVSYIQHPGAWELLLHLFSLIPCTFFLKCISHFIIIKVFDRWRITLVIGSFRIWRESRWCSTLNSFWRSRLNIDKAMAMRLPLSRIYIGLSWLMHLLLILKQYVVTNDVRRDIHASLHIFLLRVLMNIQDTGTIKSTHVVWPSQRCVVDVFMLNHCVVLSQTGVLRRLARYEVGEILGGSQLLIVLWAGLMALVNLTFGFFSSFWKYVLFISSFQYHIIRLQILVAFRSQICFCLSCCFAWNTLFNCSFLFFTRARSAFGRGNLLWLVCYLLNL